MSGSATAAGIRHQANAIAVVYVHILAQRRLAWFGDGANDLPLAVLGETDGPGDDIKIEFGTRFDTAEAQAKHRLNCGAGVDEILDRIVAKSKDRDTTPVAIVVGGPASFAVHSELADDLDRLRTGREDVLHPEARRLLDTGRDRELLARIHIVKQELDRDRDANLHTAQTLLGTLLEDPAQTTAAWAVLERDAGKICAEQKRRTAQELREILDLAGIRLKPPEPDARFIQQLDEVEELLRDGEIQAARRVLRRIRTSTGSTLVTPGFLVRLCVLQAIAAVEADDAEEGLRQADAALAIDEGSVRAYAAAAIAALKLGDLAKAAQMADQAVALDSSDPTAWQAKVQVDAASGHPLPEVPPAVASSIRHRHTLILVAINAGDYDKVISVSSGLLDEGDRSFDTLRYRCIALLNAPAPDEEAMRARLLEVERLATELIDKHEPDDPKLADALTARGVARRELGNVAGSQEDIDRAFELRPTDENAVRNRAASLSERGQTEEALALLRVAAIKDPQLLATRATLRYDSGDADGAGADLAEAERRLPGPHDQIAARLSVATAMALTGDPDGALRVAQPIRPEEGGYKLLYVLGVVDFVQGRIDQAADRYRAAAAAAPAQDGRQILAELGVRLYRAQRYAESVAAFENAGGLELDGEPRRAFAGALIAASDLVRAQALLDDEAAKRTLEPWALSVAVEIALRSDDTEAAIERLTELSGTSNSASVKIALAKALIDAARPREAEPYVDELVASADLDPFDRIRAAELSRLLGRELEPVMVGFRAFRDAPQNPKIQRSFATLVLTCDGTIPQPVEVGPDTFVRLQDEHGAFRQHVIYSDGPIEPLRDEITVEDAAKAGLLGKKVGERLEAEGRPDWTDKGWVVESILPASVHAMQDIVQHYDERFPGEPFFVTSVHIGDGTSIKDFLPIIGAVSERQDYVAGVLAKTREQLLPLGVAAKAIGASIRELMVSAQADPLRSGPLIVEWASETAQQSAASAATEGEVLVLTRSSLHTAREMGLLEILATSYTLIAPRSLEWELREELEKAEKEVTKGSSTLMAGPAGFQFFELKPDDPSLAHLRDELVELTKWVDARVTVKPRPLAMAFGAGTSDDHMRESIGHSSFDAVALAIDSGALLYADDLGLRRVSIQGKQPASFSSVTLAPALAARGIVTAGQRDDLLLRLVAANYAIIRPTPEILTAGVRRSSPMTHAELERLFVVLASEGVAPLEAARVASATLRSVAVQPVETVSIETIVDLSLRMMALRAPKPLCAQLLMRAAERDLALLPLERERVRRECAAETRR